MRKNETVKIGVLSSNNTDRYSTTNLYESSYLLARGFQLSGIEKESDGKSILIFQGKGIREAGLFFYNGGQIPAKAFADAYRTLKDLVFQENRRGEKNASSHPTLA